MEESELGNLKERSSIMEEKMERFDDVGNRLKSAFLMWTGKNKARRSMKEISFKKKYSKEGCKKS